MSCQKLGRWKKEFFYDFKVEMILSVVFYERKDIIFYKKNLKVTKIILLIIL